MFRFVLIGLFAATILNGDKDTDVKNNSNPILAEYNDTGVDPIIVGKTISTEHIAKWAKQSASYNRCGLCGEEPQAFPKN